MMTGLFRLAPVCTKQAWRPCAAWLTALWLAPLAAAQPLPSEVALALKRAQVPAVAFSAVVQEAAPSPAAAPRTLLAWNAQTPANPASVFKLLTTAAALDSLGPAWAWRTPVYLTGTLRDGVLDGSVVIRGSGDPKLVVERLWLLLRRLRQIGVQDIRGDILLDRGAFVAPEVSPASFDGEALRPYNVRPDPLLLNFKAVTYTFSVDAASGVARVAAEPALAGVQVDAAVALNGAPCGDWRADLKAQLTDPLRIRFAGSYPAACGEKAWPLAYPEPASYNARLIAQLWSELGGRLGGTVRDGTLPATARLAFEAASPPLADVVRDINKYSNNVMAEQLFFSLPAALRGDGPGGASAPAAAPVRLGEARETLRRWLAERLGETAARSTVIDNGSGLSRDARVTAQTLALLLQTVWASPVMPELIGSLPVSGLDGTLKRLRASTGRAHLKTGSLRDVTAIAGYVLADSGRRYVVVGLVNHPNAAAAKPALEALVQWTGRDGVP